MCIIAHEEYFSKILLLRWFQRFLEVGFCVAYPFKSKDFQQMRQDIKGYLPCSDPLKAASEIGNANYT